MAAGSLIYVGKSRLRRLRKERRQQRKIEKEIKRKEKRQVRLAAVTLPGFVPEIKYSALSNHDNDDDSGIDQSEESFDDDTSLGSFGEDQILLDFDCGIDLRPKTAKLGFNFVDFQKFSKMPFGPFKRKESVKKEEEVKVEAKVEVIETPKKEEEKKEEVKVEKPAVAKKMEVVEKKVEEKKDSPDGKTKEDEKTPLDANGEVKADGTTTLEIKDIGGGKLGKSEGAPLLQSEAPQPMLCCTIL